MRIGIAGGAAGLLGAWWLTRYLESLLREVAAHDATIFVGGAMATLGVVTVAACAPVLQALRVDPVRSLRL